MLEDRFGLPLSTSSVEARDAYVAGVDSVISGVAGYRESLARALAFDPSFALAHVALARGLFLDAEVAVARASASDARALSDRVSERERSHIDTVCLGIEGKPTLAREAMLKHLRSWPRDAMVLAPATSVFGLYGFSGDPDHEEQLYELLESLAPAYGEDWWFEAVYGFAACETGRLDLAWTLIERSLAKNTRHAHAAHFRTHVMYERGEVAGALDYLEAWMPGLDPHSLVHCHLSWHVTLAALAAGRPERAWEAYRTSVHPGGAWGPPLNVGTDAPSFLWRAELAGQPRSGQLWREVHDHALRHFPNAGIAFADVHGLLACIADGDTEVLGRRADEIRQRIADGHYPAGEVVLWIAEGFAAYAAGRWSDAISSLERALAQTVRIGGSRAQRDLVDLTLLAACLKAGRQEAAVGLVERRAHLPELLGEVLRGAAGPMSRAV
jgi:tetratricopeptide (TPR) repeat protein